MKLFRKIPIEVIFPILLIWQILLTFQGLDLADTGFHLTAFRFIFDDPYSVQYSTMFWLSDVCGALWMKIWPLGGLYWFKLGWVIVISATFTIYYLLLKPFLGKRNAIIGLAITLIFILQGGPECLNYDVLSTFGFAIGAFTLYRGLQNGSFVFLLLSGLLFGMSVFFKLSNLSALAFLLIIPFSVFLKKVPLSHLLKQSFTWLSGFALGMGIILLLIWQLGHLNLFINNLSFVSSMGNDIQSSHGLLPMIMSYFLGYFNVAILFIIFLSIVFAYAKLPIKFNKLFSERNSIFVFLSVGCLVTLSAVLLKDAFWSKVRYLFIALMIFRGVVLVLDKKSSNDLRMVSLAGLILLLIAPLGSDSGLGKSIWGMWILGPLALTMPVDLSLFRIKLTSVQSQFLKRTVAMAVLISAVIYAWQNPYFDVGSRIEKIYTVNHPLMRCIYTSKERAKVVNELIQEAFPKIKDEKYLLTFIEIPMVNYLSDKKPFISTSWPKLYYNPQTFRMKLEEALQLRKVLPAIIRQKQNTMMSNWPTTPDPDYLKYPEQLSKWPEHGKILNEFIARNNYQVVWENDMFQLLICVK